MAAKTVTFESKYAAHTLVRYPKVDLPSPTGVGYVNTNKGKTYQFQPVPSPRTESGFVGVLQVKVGQDKFDFDHDGWLRDGEEQGKERDAVEAFMAHREFGQDFWVQGHGPGTLYPRPQEWRADVTRATAALDDDKLTAMIAEEKRTHGRQELIDEAQDALAIVAEVIASEQAKAQQEPEPDPDPKPAAKAKPKAPAAA